MTMYDGRLRLCNQVVSEVRKHFDELVFSTIIHRNTRISEAPSVGKPVILYDAYSKGTMNYLNLAKEVLQKNNMTKISQEERILEWLGNFAYPDEFYSGSRIGKLGNCLNSKNQNCIEACATRNVEFKDGDGISEISKFPNSQISKSNIIALWIKKSNDDT